MSAASSARPWRGFVAACTVASAVLFAASGHPQAAAVPDANAIRPFRVNVPQTALDDLRRRITATRWSDRETVSDRSQGVQLASFQETVRYWGTRYDWRKAEAKLNALPQFMTNIDGLDIHFIHVRSKHPDALPVIITHGWPGSVFEQIKVIAPLTDPTAHGGRAEDAFVLLHGWPYDIHSYADVTPLLTSAGYRVIVPHLRGYGTTRFFSGDTIRNAQQSGVALDIIALMDALKIGKAVIGGFDWGPRTANIMAALWPERCRAMVSVSGYLIGSPEANKQPLPPKAELDWWYQYYFATERGRVGYEKYRHEFAKLI